MSALEAKLEEAAFVEDEIICEASGSAEDQEFDNIVGALEQILIDGGFTSVQTTFCRRHCVTFRAGEESSLDHTEIFQQYTAMMEDFINTQLTEKFPGFSMARFESMLVTRQDEIGGEIFDILLSLSDFAEFKEVMESHQKAREEEKCGEESLAVKGTQVNPAEAEAKMHTSP